MSYYKVRILHIYSGFLDSWLSPIVGTNNKIKQQKSPKSLSLIVNFFDDPFFLR